MKRLEVSGAVRLLYGSLGVKGLKSNPPPPSVFPRNISSMSEGKEVEKPSSVGTAKPQAGRMLNRGSTPGTG